MAESTVAYFLNCTSLAIIAFSIHLLILRAKKQRVYLPLAACLGAIAVLISQPLLQEHAPGLQLLFLLLALPSLYLIPPCFWLYVQGITSGSNWQLSGTDGKHFALSGLGLLIVSGALLLPGELRHAILVEGQEEVLESTPQMLRYFTAAAILYDNLVAPFKMDVTIKNLIILIMIWSVALWGLRQKPGFEELYLSDEETQHALKAVIDGKYQRSALNEKLANNIVNKLHKAMEQDRLFLIASLSLPKLAKHTSTSPYYISQTLNEPLGVNFFRLCKWS